MTHRLGLLALMGALAWPVYPADSPTTTTGAPQVLPAVVLAGRTTDAGSGAPLAGVRITLDGGRSPGTLSDRNGEYILALDDSWVGREVMLVAELPGYESVRRALRLAEGTNTLDIALQRRSIALDEIVASAARAATPAQMTEISGAIAVQVLPGRFNPDFQTESYALIQDNVFLATAANPLSTFSIDVDRASYANVRRFIRDGQRPPVDAVRVEELINYFPYSDPEPDGEAPLAIYTEVAPAPWQPLHKLVRIALKGRGIDLGEAPRNNLVFLLDVSGSMSSPDKLPLLKTALGMLVNQLRPQDQVAIVVYAGAAGLVLPSTPGSEKERILDAIQNLQAGGSTAGGAGIRLAYEVAAEHHVARGNNRVILATDGDFNVGVSSDAEMVRLVEEKRDQGTFLTVLGFGTGNLKDSKMEQIADHGNGNFAYIDSALEAKKVLVNEMGGTLLTIAKDVKLQVEFNPAKVAAYRLIGYENRLLAAEDFADDTKDAGELGAGHSVTALYEVIPVGVDSPVEVRGLDSLRYQAPSPPTGTASPELLFVKLRYKDPAGGASRLLETPVLDRAKTPSEDFRFATAVAAWGMLLRDSEYCSGFTLSQVADLARNALGEDRDGYRSEFVRLLETARTMELLAKEPGAR